MTWDVDLGFHCFINWKWRNDKEVRKSDDCSMTEMPFTWWKSGSINSRRKSDHPVRVWSDQYASNPMHTFQVVWLSIETERVPDLRKLWSSQTGREAMLHFAESDWCSFQTVGESQDLIVKSLKRSERKEVREGLLPTLLNSSNIQCWLGTTCSRLNSKEFLHGKNGIELSAPRPAEVKEEYYWSCQTGPVIWRKTHAFREN